VTAGSAILMEILLTFFLVWTILRTAADKESQVSLPTGLPRLAVSVHPHAQVGTQPLAPLCIGMAVLADVLLGVPVTGASMNPARSLGPALLADAWDHHYVYWIGPTLGALAALVVYRAGFRTPPGPKGE
jgi:glycerol uptake facilitator-like aquaporin